MATKVKPTRLQITGTPQAGQVPIYVSHDCFCRGSSGCQGTVIGPSSSCDGDIPLFCGTCGDCIIDSGEKLCDYAKCCDIPTDNCQLLNGCGYQTTSCMVNDFSSPNSTTYPTTEAVCCYVGQKIAGAYIYKGTVNTYEDLPTTGLTAGDVYNVTTAHTTSPEFPAGANLAWTGSDWDVLGGLTDLSGKQDVLTAGPNITIASNVISGDFNFATSNTAAACTTKCVCIPEITQLCIGQQITVKPSVTNTACDTNLKLNDFTAYPIRYNNVALTSSTDGYVRGADCLSTFIFDGNYWRVASKSYDINTTYAFNFTYDAGKHIAGVGKYAISRYSLVMEKADGTWETLKETSTNYSTATTKTVNTNGFRLNSIRYYGTTTIYANGALIAANRLYSKAASVDMRYSTNCGATTDWAEGDYIYLVGTIGNDGLFYLDTTTRWTKTLPNTKDGKVYIRLGIALEAAGYRISLLEDKPIYYYDDGLKIYYYQDDRKQDVLVSGTTIKTINGCDVLGSGDLCIAGGVNSVNGQTGAVCLTIPTDNCELANGCGYTTCTGTVTATDLQCYVQCCDMSGYQLTCNMVCDLTGADNTHYPTAKAVADAIQGAGGGDMMKSTYDPCNCNDDAFDYCNFHNTPTIPTDNCQLANGCGYTTCTGTLSSCADVISALGYTPYNSTNPNGYTTCTGTLVTSDIACLAQCCDIPTDNCQLANGCGYTTCTGTLSTCSDITTALGYTPYSAANPCGYTTCTGTVVAGDLTPYAKSCDLCTVATTGKYCDLTGKPTIPTDNCELDNGCGYVKESCVACINGCCLINGGDICIEGGGKGCPKIEYLVVGGGGGDAPGTVPAGGGGGVIQGTGIICCGVEYEVRIGLGGKGGSCCSDGCPSYICGTDFCVEMLGGCTSGVSGNGYPGGGVCYACSGGGGSNGPGLNGFCYCYNGSNRVHNGKGGPGCKTDILGTMCGFGGGGGGDGCAFDGGGAGTDGVLGGGGGNGQHNGGDGIVVIRYAKDGSDGITVANGGCKYECNGYCIHKFMYDENFIVVNNVNCPQVDILLVGGGGGGGMNGSSSACPGGGGGGGGIIYRCRELLIEKSYCIKIGVGGGCGYYCTNNNFLIPTAGGDTCFGDLIAYGGGIGGSACCNTPSACGTGGGGVGNCYTTQACLGAKACFNCALGYGGGCGHHCKGGGGGGAGGAGGDANGTSCQPAGCGGDGLGFDISGEMCWYSGGGGGGGTRLVCGPAGCGGCGGGGDGNGYGKLSGDCDATYYGGGGGGSLACVCCCSGCGCQGIFILRYPVSCGYNITGGDCCYECNGNCIHIFTSDGTLTVN